MRFAFVTDELPVAGVAGHLAFSAALIDWLQADGHEVEILLVRPRFRLPFARYGGAPVLGPGIMSWRGIVVSYRPAIVAGILARAGLRRLPARIASLLRQRVRAQKYGIVDAVLGAFISAEQTAWCAARLAVTQPDGVIIDTIFRAFLLTDKRMQGVRSLILANDVFHLRHRALATAGYRVHPALLSRRDEAALLNLGDGIAAIQPEEAAMIASMCPERRVLTTPMPAVPCPRPGTTTRDPDRLVFVGSDALPNLDGLRWFLAEIWPRLLAWRPALTLELIGNCGRALGHLPVGVHRHGQLTQMGPILHSARLAIAPLRVGSGLKIKLLDYARHGLITVATPVSMQGFAADQNAPFIAAADALSFTAAIIKTLQAPYAPQDEDRALAYVARHYGIEQSFAGLAEVLGLPVKLNAS